MQIANLDQQRAGGGEQRALVELNVRELASDDAQARNEEARDEADEETAAAHRTPAIGEPMCGVSCGLRYTCAAMADCIVSSPRPPGSACRTGRKARRSRHP